MLECSDGTYYIGKTQDLEKRLRQHNGYLKGGAKYTRSRRPVRMIFSESHRSLSMALKREFELKTLSREEKTKFLRA